jgi:hypothetical protein
MSTPGEPVAHRDNPYFGLAYYDEQFGAWFFGREAESDKITANLQAARLTLLHAESGVGKSSLLRAGVAWRMRRLADDRFARRRPLRFVPVVFSYWKDDPVADLARSIGEAIKPYLVSGNAPRPHCRPTGSTWSSRKSSRNRLARRTRACSSCSTSSRNTSFTAPGNPCPGDSPTNWLAASTGPTYAPTS